MRLNLPIRVAALVVAIGVLVPAVAFAVSQTVTIQNFSFRPTTATINVGDTITWANADPLAHTATSDAGAFDTGAIPAGGTKSVTFALAGTYAYHCSIHTTMTGTIVVLAATATPAPSTPRPTPAPTAPPTAPATTAPPATAPPATAAPTIAPPTTLITPPPTASPSPSPSPSASPSAAASPSATPAGTPIAVPTQEAAAGPSAAAGPALAGGPGPLLAAGGVALALALAGSAFFLYRRR